MGKAMVDLNGVRPESGLKENCHRRGYDSLEQEFDYWVDAIEGKIPEDLEGTLFRNGPGRLQLGGKKYGHWFDGDGMICAFTFKSGRLHFKNRYVRTRKYIEETKAQKILYRGLGTQRPGGFLTNAFRPPANVANTNVIYHGQKLLALWEGGEPHLLSPSTLETLGSHRYDGKLSPMRPFSAHGKINPRTKELINFGVAPGIKPQLMLYKVSAEGKLVTIKSLPLKFPAFCHDFALTEHYAVFFISPLMIKNPFSFLAGFKSLGESLVYDSNYPMDVWVISLDDFSIQNTFEIDPFIVVHYGNAYEEEGQLVVDLFQYDHWNVNRYLMNVFDHNIEEGGELCRYRIHLQGDAGVERQSFNDARGGDFPSWNWAYSGQSYQYLYANVLLDNGTMTYFNGIEKFDLQNDVATIYDCGPGRFTSEAIFVARNNPQSEDDGYVVATIYNAITDCNEVIVLDAKNISRVICRAYLTHFLPFSFHGSFVPHTFLDD